MIDFFDIRLHHKFTASELASVLKIKNPKHSRYTRTTTDSSWMSQAELIIERNSNHWNIRILCCPAKILGNWNSIGGSDLHDLVLTTLPRIFSAANISWTDRIDNELNNKEYCIREVHIANIMRLTNRCHIEFVDNLFYALGPTKRPTYAKRGKGLIISSNNRNVTAYLYVKHLDVVNRGLKAYARRMQTTTGVSKMMSALDRRTQMAASLLGPRLEFRFGDQFFRHNKLQHPENWAANTAQELFKQQLIKLCPAGSVKTLPNRVEVEAKLAGTPAYTTALLWLHGEAVNEILSRSTFKRHADTILKVLELDIAQPHRSLSQLTELEVKTVLNETNIVEHFDLDDPEVENLLRNHPINKSAK